MSYVKSVLGVCKWTAAWRWVSSVGFHCFPWPGQDSRKDVGPLETRGQPQSAKGDIMCAIVESPTIRGEQKQRDHLS